MGEMGWLGEFAVPSWCGCPSSGLAWEAPPWHRGVAVWAGLPSGAVSSQAALDRETVLVMSSPT